MHTAIIAAMSQNLAIGTKTGLPWHLPSDLRRFRLLTMGKPVILGRKTLELLGKPLDGCGIVLTRQRDFQAPGCLVAHDLPEAMDLAWEQALSSNASEVMVIGGGEIYQQTIGAVDRMYLTIVKGRFPGTTFFPASLPRGSRWEISSQEYVPEDIRNSLGYHVFVLDRVSSFLTRSSSTPPALHLASVLPPALEVQPNSMGMT